VERWETCQTEHGWGNHPVFTRSKFTGAPGTTRTSTESRRADDYAAVKVRGAFNSFVEAIANGVQAQIRVHRHSAVPSGEETATWAILVLLHA
jgi:hypothetical protein